MTSSDWASAAARNTAEWRRISLERQLPSPRPPAGVIVPVVVCGTALLLVAVLCAVLLGQLAGWRVPEGVTDSQKKLVSVLAREVNASANRSAGDLRDAAGHYADDPAHDARKLLEVANRGESRWRGTVVVDSRTRQLVAAQGEPVPVERIPSGLTRTSLVPIRQGADVRLLTIVPLDDGRLLAGTGTVRVRRLGLSPDRRQTILLASRAGLVSPVEGSPLAATDPLNGLVQEAMRRTARARLVAVVGPASAAGPSRPASPAATVTPAATSTPAATDRLLASTGDPTTDETPSQRTAPVVVAARIGSLDLSVVSVVHAPLTNGGSRWQGVPPALGLLSAAGLAVLIVRQTVISPVRRLLRYATAVACGDGVRPKGLPRISEARRLVRALDAIRTGQPSSPKTRLRGFPMPAVVAVGLAALAVTGWSGVVGYTYGSGAVDVPRQIVDDTQDYVAATAGTLSDSLDGGLTLLAQAAAAHRDGEPVRLRPTLRRLVDREPRFRSAYVVDATGATLVRAGREALRPARELPGDSGVRLEATSGRLPIIYAYVSLPARQFLVAEYDIHYLTDLLRRVGGRVRVVDSGLRTILDTDGHLAFSRLSAALQDAAGNALSGRSWAGVTTVNGTRELVVSAAIGVHRSTTHLEWSVVAARSVDDFRLGANDLRRRALLVGLLATCVALTLLGWQYFVHLRPLRELVRVAERLAAGDTSAVLSLHRPDEIGALGICLEICRQVLVDGEYRLAGAVRLRGAVGTHTKVLPRITGSRPPGGSPRRSAARRL